MKTSLLSILGTSSPIASGISLTGPTFNDEPITISKSTSSLSSVICRWKCWKLSWRTVGRPIDLILIIFKLSEISMTHLVESEDLNWRNVCELSSLLYYSNKRLFLLLVRIRRRKQYLVWWCPCIQPWNLAVSIDRSHLDTYRLDVLLGTKELIWQKYLSATLRFWTRHCTLGSELYAYDHGTEFICQKPTKIFDNYLYDFFNSSLLLQAVYILRVESF